jgi:hypothetical protein
MTSGIASATVQNRRKGRFVRVVRYASGTPSRIEAAVTIPVSTRLLTTIWRVLGRRRIAPISPVWRTRPPASNIHDSGRRTTSETTPARTTSRREERVSQAARTDDAVPVSGIYRTFSSRSS